MRGGPIDLTPFGAVLTGLGVLYWLLAAIALLLAFAVPKSKFGTMLAVLLVALVFGYKPATVGWQMYQVRDRVGSAMAHFETRCKGAGEKIVRTVENVDGVVWMKWREKTSNRDNYADQFKLNDPYGQDCGAEGCIASLLRVTGGEELNPEEARRHRIGYRFVETVDPEDGQRYRYIGVNKLDPRWTDEAIAREKKLTGKSIGPSDYRFTLERKPIERFTARYGITWDDISTREDRERWIAGGSLRVIDLQTNEVIAERVGYMMDRGQGSQEGFRSPWLYAAHTACPAFSSSESRNPIKTSRSRDFIRRVLEPQQGE